MTVRFPKCSVPITRLAALFGLMASALSAAAAPPLEFSRDIQPILSDKCFACHGPDENARKKQLRLDTREGLFGTTGSGQALVTPGDPGASEIIRRISHLDVDERMPPVESKRELVASDIEKIRLWIAQGAPWEGHWAFEPPSMPALPEVSVPDWCRNEIDYFILQKLEEADLTPSPEARRETLLRRVSLDLTGLPPTPAEVADFLADTGDDAYEKVVDRLLASPRYGERMAFPWLDAARYADTNGYQRDTKRVMWPWRDWVIRAFNENMPFDRFTIEQLAGDLLPNATQDQIVATGFNRNHRINGEGGIIPEEYAVEYVVDRVATTSTAWMGLTVGCARCHDHKYDPVSQKEFYELYAFFNQVSEEGKGRERGNDRPFIAVPTPEEQAQIQELDRKIAAVEKTLAAPNARLDPLQQAWEQDLSTKFASLAWAPLGPVTASSHNGAVLAVDANGAIRVSGPNPDKEVYELTFVATGPIRSLKLDLLTDSALPATGPGRSANGNVVLSEFEVERAPADAPEQVERLTVSEALADFAQEPGDYQITGAIDGNEESGWATGSHVRREARTAIFVLDEDTPIQAGDRVTLRLKHTTIYAQHTMGYFQLYQSASGALAGWAGPVYGPWYTVGPFPMESDDNSKLLDIPLPPEEGFDPDRSYEPAQLRWVEMPEWNDGTVHQFEEIGRAAQYLYRTIHAAVPQKVSLSLGSNDAIKIWLDGEVKLVTNKGRGVEPDQERLDLFLPQGDHELLIKIVNHGGGSGYYFRSLDDQGASLLATMKALAIPEAERSEADRQRLTLQFRGRDPEWLASRTTHDALRKEREDRANSVTTTMVMDELAEKRDTYLLKRGAYDAPDTMQKLFPSVPARLGEMDESLPKNRLGLARWLVDPAHPLTARVRVNLYWQMYFGMGLVRTGEDFGTQGSPPSHPELLDWLALRFIESGWDVKAMQKLIVMSATYRQSSRQSADLREKDPENILLARAPRFRLPAEIIRDQALEISGLMNDTIGGPSVYPYQPKGMWSSLSFQNMDEFDTNFYTPDTGENLYRRGLYTYWKRTIAPPRMQIFDAADRERCSLGKLPTNTPMQALVLLNDPTFIEAARHLAGRMIEEGGERSADRIRYGYSLALAHEPSLAKQEILLGGLSDYQTHFSTRPDDAAALLGVGDSAREMEVPDAELAAYTAVASVILNLDELITRE